MLTFHGCICQGSFHMVSVTSGFMVLISYIKVLYLLIIYLFLLKCRNVVWCVHRLELCPEKRMLFYPNLPKVVGSDFLEARVRDIHGVEGNPFACHVFGHTHFCWDTMLDGVRLASFYLFSPLYFLRMEKFKSILHIGLHVGK